jgi:hypothetical protein
LTLATIFWSSLAILAQTPHYTLSLDSDHFTINSGIGEEQVLLEPQIKNPPKVIAYRKDDNFAVWDSRGLTLRRGSSIKSYHFQDFPVDPNFFDPDEIQAVRKDVKLGVKSLAANGLSGARRIGQRVFFLVRWSDSSNKPWLEALVQVDLDERDLAPKILGRFSGLSGANLPIEDRLFLQNGSVSAVTERASDWGISDYSFASRNFDYVSLGEHLVKWYPTGLYLEETAYGSKVGGQLSLASLQAKPLFEDRGAIGWLDGNSPPVAIYSNSSGQVLRNCDSGFEQILTEGAVVRRTTSGILAWSPAQDPQHAVLLSFDRWARLTAWNKNGSTPRLQRKRGRRRR